MSDTEAFTSKDRLYAYAGGAGITVGRTWPDEKTDPASAEFHTIGDAIEYLRGQRERHGVTYVVLPSALRQAEEAGITLDESER